MEPSGISFPGWEKRWNPLLQEWVVYAPHRNRRPWSFQSTRPAGPSPAFDPSCYLCPGNLRSGGERNPEYRDLFLFDNDHPVLSPAAPEILEGKHPGHQGLYLREKAEGYSRVMCYDPSHHLSLGGLGRERITRVLEAWREQTSWFRRQDRIRFVFIFENRGEAVGVSNPHPHCQIYASDFVFPVVERELRSLRSPTTGRQANLFEDILESEQQDGIRIITQNQGALAFVPFFARFAYETYIFPKSKCPNLDYLSDSELNDLAEVLETVLRKFDALFGMPFPYILAISQAPVDGFDYGDYRFHLHFLPPWRQPGLLKYLAGPETGGGAFMADTLPEEKAAQLRDQPI